MRCANEQRATTGRARSLLGPAGALLLLSAAGAFVSCRDTSYEPVDATRLRSYHGRAAGYNLLLVTLDTTRADRLGCYGYSRAETPTIDALAARGVRFANVTAPAPVTLPSHSTLMTGLHVPTHGVRNNGTFRLLPEHTTLAERLQQAGYDTAAFVGSFVLDARYGLDQGFRNYDDDVNPEGAVAPSGQFHERGADLVSNAALDWLDGRGGAEAPFFAWVHYFDPHAPYDPPPRFAKAHAGRPYDGEISFMDAELGRVVEFLRSRDLLDRTLIVVTADHGEGLGEHGERSHSLLVYESTMRVPLVFSNPVLFEEEWVVEERLAGLVDLVPTLLGLLGLEEAEGLEGVDLFQAAADGDRALYIESMVPLLNYGWAPVTGLRRRGDKYIHAPTPEYYELAERPLEGQNRYDGSEVAAGLAARLAEQLTRWPPIEGLPEIEVRLDPETVARLSALGYVQSDAPADATTERADPKEMLPVWNRLSEAQILSGQGRHEEGLALLREALELDPEDARIWYAVSLIQRRMGRFAEAEETIRRGLLYGPSGEGYVRLAQFLLARKSYDAFERAIDEARELDPDNGTIDITVGDRLAMDGDFAGALEAFRRALAIDPVRAGPLAREKIAAAEARLGR